LNELQLRMAERTRAIAPFQVMELVKRAVAMEQQGRPVIHLSIGEPDFTAPPTVLAALERATREGRTQYSAAVGTIELREAIAADYLRRYDIVVDPARIIVTAGASAALTLACCALVNPGDEVLLTDPSYPCNRHFVAAFDGRARAVPVFEDTRFQLTRDLVDQHWGPAVRGVLLASPANPTGTSIPFETLGQIVNTVRQRGGFTIVDEIYLGLTYDGPARSALALGDDVIVCNSFSKTFAMTGWRLGWLVVPSHTVPVFEKLAQNLFICASTLAQHAALGCFEADALAVCESRRNLLRDRRDALIPELERIGFRIPVRPDGAFYVWMDCSRFGDSGRLADRLLDEAAVSLVPGHDFGVNDPGRWMRLSYANPIERLQEAVARMANCLGS
jgi:aspartate/methionine/tyrosine aminotransferase